MKCSRCGEREASVEPMAMGEQTGPLCRECAVELAAQFVAGAAGDVKQARPPLQVTEKLLALGRRAPNPVHPEPAGPGGTDLGHRADQPAGE
jgi:hypothetical protein